MPNPGSSPVRPAPVARKPGGWKWDRCSSLAPESLSSAGRSCMAITFARQCDTAGQAAQIRDSCFDAFLLARLCQLLQCIRRSGENIEANCAAGALEPMAEIGQLLVISFFPGFGHGIELIGEAPSEFLDDGSKARGVRCQTRHHRRFDQRRLVAIGRRGWTRRLSAGAFATEIGIA